MIQERHKWLLRNVDTAYDSAPYEDGRRPCRVCRVQDKGEVPVSRDGMERHLAAHRQEKVVREPRVMSADEFLESLDA